MATVLQHFEDTGTANTTTAKDGIRVAVVVEGVMNDSGKPEIHIGATTTNFAVMDNAVGAARVGLLQDGKEVASYLVQTSRNPGRGFQPPTVRQASISEPLPLDVKFNQVGLKFFNSDFTGEPFDFMKVIEIGVTLLTTTLAAI